MEQNYPGLVVTDKGERALKGGHPWVYEGEVVTSDEAEDGGIVNVLSQKGRYLGTGFYNSRSKIRVRLLTRNANDRIDEAFFERRLTWAIGYRRAVMGTDFSACRLVFGEADMLPGLTVDKFGDVLSVQITSLGAEQRKDMIYGSLCRILSAGGDPVRVLYERNELALREKEGLPLYQGYYLGEGDGHVEITENGLRFDVDYINGQKTGFFLDQKYNRLSVRNIARGRRVLDLFTHTGAFALNAAAGGAAEVTAVDISKEALDTARRNAALNGLSPDFLCADVFDLLSDESLCKKKAYDYIILDPPAFTKSNATIKAAFSGYKEINKKAMRLLPRGGFLSTCSCSHFMRDSIFCQMLHEAAREASVTLRQVEARTQSPDHPILWNVPETAYLKFYTFQVE